MVAARICCAIDFSDASLLALVEAAELARWSGAELTLIHVHPVPEGEVRPEAFAMASVDLHRDMGVWSAEAERRVGAPVRTEVVAGDPATEVLRLARRGSGLLVLGARGRSAPGGRRLGSVAARVAREAPCPVIVVRPRVPLPDEAETYHAA
ncbi:universal stress protein [Anaeromyxobacter sp. SG64]|uniref:universal stress protein n=1 Tax=Anaeromyxobacter sp. SG64 TaxID=2925409 RepID=UPI001F5863AB|nr:universal stress protein [Anaeromyxobacter sp. SG64]